MRDDSGGWILVSMFLAFVIAACMAVDWEMPVGETKSDDKYYILYYYDGDWSNAYEDTVYADAMVAVRENGEQFGRIEYWDFFLNGKHVARKKCCFGLLWYKELK